MAKTTEMSNKKKYIKLALILVLAAALLYAAIFFVIEQRAKSAEKKEFLANKAQIEEIAKKITAKYPSSEEKHEESCRYQSAKFAKGDLYCGVSVNLVYRDIDIEKANTILNNSAAEARVALNPEQSVRKRSNIFIEPNETEARLNQHDKQGIFGDLKERNCGLSFYYDTGTQSDKSLVVFISCKRVSKAEYFPVEKY